jgi:hypothetical protein
MGAAYGMIFMQPRMSRRVGVSLDLSFLSVLALAGFCTCSIPFFVFPSYNTFLPFPKTSKAVSSVGFFSFLAISLHRCLTSVCAMTVRVWTLIISSLPSFTSFWLLTSTLLSRLSLADILCQCLFHFLHSLYTLSSSKHVHVANYR